MIFARAVPACLLPLLATLALGSPAYAQDASNGRKIYRTCLPCHVIETETNKLGPYLTGVFGRTAGQVPGFRYSPAMRDAGAAGLIWNEANLSAFLSSPKRLVPGTSMRFWGFWSQSDIDDLVAYLKASH